MKGIDIGDTYTNRKAARTFVHFIAEAIRREMRQEYCKAKFLTVLFDGSKWKKVMKKRRGRMKKRGRKNFHKLFLQLNWTSCRGSSLAAWNHHALMTFLPANYVCLMLHAKLIMNTIMPNCCCKSN